MQIDEATIRLDLIMILIAQWNPHCASSETSDAVGWAPSPGVGGAEAQPPPPLSGSLTLAEVAPIDAAVDAALDDFYADDCMDD